MPTSRCSERSSSCSWRRSCASRAPERLVEQQDARVEHERPRQGHALLLAAGQLSRPALRELLHPRELERLADARRDVGLRQLLVLQARTRRWPRRPGTGTARSSGRPCSPAGGAAASPERSLPSSRMRPESGCSKPAIMRSVVVLPQPDAPSSEKNSPAGNVEIDAAHHRDAAEGLLQRLEPDGAPGHRDGVREPGEVRDEPVDVGVGVLHREQPLLDLAPGRQEDAAVVLDEPVRLPEPVVDAEEVAVLADALALERDAALRADADDVPAEARDRR